MLERFIDAMNAASRRLEAKAALIRAETESESVRYQAFVAGAVAGIKHYAEARSGFDHEAVFRGVHKDAREHSRPTPEAG